MPAPLLQTHRATTHQAPGGGLTGAVRRDHGWCCFSIKQSKTQRPATTGHHHASSHPPSAPSGQGTAYPGKFGKSLGASTVASPACHLPHTPGSGHQFPPTCFFSTIRQIHESKCVGPRCPSLLFLFICPVAPATTYQHIANCRQPTGHLLVSAPGQLPDVGMEGHVLHGRLEVV